MGGGCGEGLSPVPVGTAPALPAGCGTGTLGLQSLSSALPLDGSLQGRAVGVGDGGVTQAVGSGAVELALSPVLESPPQGPKLPRPESWPHGARLEGRGGRFLQPHGLSGTASGLGTLGQGKSLSSPHPWCQGAQASPGL